MLRQVLEKVDENDWNTHVVFTFITHDGTRTYSVEAGGSAKKASERSQKNLADKLKEANLKLPLYPTPQIIETCSHCYGWH